MPPINCRTSTLQAGWLAKGKVVVDPEGVRRSRCLYRPTPALMSKASFVILRPLLADLNSGQLFLDMPDGTEVGHFPVRRNFPELPENPSQLVGRHPGTPPRAVCMRH